MSWPVHNGFKPQIDPSNCACVTVHNNWYNNDWNESEYTLTEFANNYYNSCNWIHLDHNTCTCRHLYLYTSWPYLPATIITPVTEYNLTIHLYLYTPWPIYTLTLSVSDHYYTCTCIHLDLLTCPPRSLYCCFRASICWLSFSGNSTCCFSAICRPVFITCSTSGFNSLIVR